MQVTSSSSMDMNQEKQINVLVADDSAFMRTALTRMIESDKQLKVIGTALNGIDALEKIVALKPDVVTLDIEMPRLDGLSVLRRVMQESPLPVIIISSLSQEGAEASIEALELGAFECIPKELSYVSLDIVKIREYLVETIKAAAASQLVAIPSLGKPIPPMAEMQPGPMSHSGPTPAILAIGSSTGGPKALQEVLTALPANFPVPALIVQHMPAGFTGPFATRLNSICKVRVKEAEQGEVLEPGTVLIAPATWHLTVQRRTPAKCCVALAKEPANTLHRPSVDVMMLSVAEAFRSQAVGVILTGMGADGAQGMKAIYQAGGHTIGQDAATCAVYGMPRACAEMGILKRVAPLTRISSEIMASMPGIRSLSLASAT